MSWGRERMSGLFNPHHSPSPIDGKAHRRIVVSVEWVVPSNVLGLVGFGVETQLQGMQGNNSVMGTKNGFMSGAMNLQLSVITSELTFLKLSLTHKAGELHPSSHESS